MASGLVEGTQTRQTGTGENQPSDRLFEATEGEATTDYANAGADTQTASNPFAAAVDASNWSRQDIVTAATVLNSVLFLALVYMEVKR